LRPIGFSSFVYTTLPLTERTEITEHFFSEYSRRGVGPASYGREAVDSVRDQMAQVKAYAREKFSQARRH
jgi:hypothetical protein